MKTQLKSSCNKERKYVLRIRQNFLLFLLISLFSSVFGQSPLAINNNAQGKDIQEFENSTASNNDKEKLDFINKYEIDESKKFNGKILCETPFLSQPTNDPKAIEKLLAAGQIVSVFKFCDNNKGFWAIETNGSYGFVQTTSIMAISDKSMSYYNPEYDTPPELISLIRPKYPKEARKENITGSVLVKAFINEKGIVEKTEISKGIDQLNEAAINAVKKAKFKPAEYKGKPVSVWINLSIDFE